MTSRRHWNEEDINIVKSLAAERKSARMIAEIFGVSRHSILGLCHKRDITLDPTNWGVNVTKRAKKLKEPKPKYVKGRRLPPKEPKELPIEIIGVRLFCDDPEFDPSMFACRFPVGGVGVDLVVCGRPVGSKYPYCDHHASIAYTKARGPRKQWKAKWSSSRF